ncbi:MAG: TIGR00180 family glycosyltransferase [Burkholderiales bacterium]|nr:TIGR00180 family glycosyltransferase [Burkholderiales bacterium]
MNLLTIIVPTYNRSTLLRRCLDFIRKQHPQVPLIVADSSAAAEMKVNESIATAHPGLRYFAFDPSTPGAQKFADAVTKVETKYACFCADDDLINVSAAIACAQFLADHPDYAACHGTYVRFSCNEAEDIQFEDWEYRSPSIDGDDPALRVLQLLSNYEAPFYAVQPTAVLSAALQACECGKFTMMQELANALWMAMSGKIRRVDGLYYFRQAGDAATHAFSEPYVYLSERFPTINVEYGDMAKALVDRFAHASSDASRSVLLRTLYFGFLVYLYRSIDFVQLSRTMVPELPTEALLELRRIRPRAFQPGIRFVWEQMLTRIGASAKRYAGYDRGTDPRRYRAGDRTVWISRALDETLRKADRSMIRTLFGHAGGVIAAEGRQPDRA